MPELTKGAIGNWVFFLQRKLNDRGYHTNQVHGNFDESTRGAVIGFQRDMGINITGKTDPVTWMLLLSSKDNQNNQLPIEAPTVIAPVSNLPKEPLELGQISNQQPVINSPNWQMLSYVLIGALIVIFFLSIFRNDGR